MGKFEDLLKLGVPIFFLIVWAINQVLNKEGQQPAKPRSPTPNGGGSWPPRDLREFREAQRRAAEASLGRPRPASGTGRDDGIVILEVDNRAPRPGGRQAASGRGRRPARRPSSNKESAGARIEATRPPVSTEAKTLLTDQATVTTRATSIDSAAAETWLRGVRDRMATPESLRQAIIMNMILKPPPGAAILRRPR